MEVFKKYLTGRLGAYKIDEGIMNLVRGNKAKTGINIMAFISAAIVEKLQRDGFLEEEKKKLN